VVLRILLVKSVDVGMDDGGAKELAWGDQSRLIGVLGQKKYTTISIHPITITKSWQDNSRRSEKQWIY
jgi:hypothetical protein